MLLSAVQQSDSDIYIIYTNVYKYFFLFHTPFPYIILQDIEYSYIILYQITLSGKKFFLMFKVYHLSLETKQGYPQRSCPLILYWNPVFKRVNFESKKVFVDIILHLENINQKEIIRYYKVGILKYSSYFYNAYFSKHC